MVRARLTHSAGRCFKNGCGGKPVLVESEKILKQFGEPAKVMLVQDYIVFLTGRGKPEEREVTIENLRWLLTTRKIVDVIGRQVDLKRAGISQIILDDGTVLHFAASFTDGATIDRITKMEEV